MTTNAEGERTVKLWYNDVFRPATNLSEAINKSQACNATMKHLDLKRFSDAKTELGKLGFNLDAVTYRKRYVSFKFDTGVQTCGYNLCGFNFKLLGGPLRITSRMPCSFAGNIRSAPEPPIKKSNCG